MRLVLIFVLFSVLIALVKGAKENTRDVSIVDFGADKTGTNDSSSAIANAIRSARQNGTNVYVPAGRFIHNTVITITGVHFYGDGDQSILYATHASNRALQMEGSGSGIRKMKVTGTSQARMDAGWNNLVFANNANNYIISNITLASTDNYFINGTRINGVGGMILYYSNNGTIEYNTVAWTWADGIHTTGVSNNITVRYNLVHHNADDCIAVVSYYPSEVTNVQIYSNTIYSNTWARGISVIGGSRVRVNDNTLTNIIAAAFWVAAESVDYNTMVPHDIIYARNKVINATNVAADCALTYSLPASGVSNGNTDKGSLYNVLFVDNVIEGSCLNQVRTEGGAMGEVVWAGNTFTKGRSTIAELKAPTASVYSIGNVYDGGNVNGFYASGSRNALYSLNDSIANVQGGSVRGYWLKDGSNVFKNLQIQNAQLANTNTAIFSPFIGTNNATGSLFVSNVYNSGNQVPANFGVAPPTATSFTHRVTRPRDGKITISANTFFDHSSTNYRLLAVYGGVGGKVDISFEHDLAIFSITDNSLSYYSFKYVVATQTSGVALALCTIEIDSSDTSIATISSSYSSSASTTAPSSTTSPSSSSPSSTSSPSFTSSPSSLSTSSPSSTADADNGTWRITGSFVFVFVLFLVLL